MAKKRRKLILSDGKYKEEYIRIAQVASEEFGADEVRLGMLCGNVTRRTIIRWMKRYPEFKKVIIEGRDVFDGSRVERSLVHRAVGFEYEEVTTEEIFLKNPRDKNKVRIPAIKRKSTTKLYPADVSAGQFWLINRQPERWKNTKYVQFTGKITDDRIRRLNIDSLKKLPKQDIEDMAKMVYKFEEGKEDLEKRTLH